MKPPDFVIFTKWPYNELSHRDTENTKTKCPCTLWTITKKIGLANFTAHKPKG